jgi:Kef-type K+ transport system membrane component KefB/mannitol/fructose-specific phosphotransferase system IIA component (Ntr-type)/nucleotide-binding universal stress UspA family protein
LDVWPGEKVAVYSAAPEEPPVSERVLSLPITDPVLIVALAMALFLAAPLLMERLRMPGIIGLIVAGAVVGPHGVGLLDRDPTIVLLGTVGLLYLVFLAGLELDLHRFAEYRRGSVIFGAISFGVPMGLAALIMPWLGFSLSAAVLIGSIIGSHTLLAYPIVSRLGLVKNRAVTTVVGGTLVTDTLALGVLAVVAGSLEGEISAVFFLRLFGVLAIYVTLVVVGVPRLGRWFFRNTPGQAPAEFIFLMVVLFGSAFLASLAGAQPIIGAFLAGLTLNRLIPNQGPLMNRVRFVGNALFIPFFLISVGMLVDARVLVGDPGVWIIAATLTVMVHAGKLGASWFSQRLFHYSREEGLLMFGLSVPQAAATLAVTFVGLEIGLFDEIVVNAVIVMILVTGLVGPSLVERYGRRIARHEEQKPYDPDEAPRRILIPISNPATAEALLDIAFLLRGRQSDEPIYPLMVVPEAEEAAEAKVAEAEKMLGHAVIYAAGADVPVVPLTRVDRNIPTGITRGIAETRSSLVVIGWDARRTADTRIFGSVLDQLLEQTRQLVLVAKLGHPLNTTRRILLVVPPASKHHTGFYGAVQAVKLMANQLGATIEGLVVQGDTARYQTLVGEIRPQVPIEWRFISRWSELTSALRDEFEPDDLVVVLSARRGAVSWDRELERLPTHLPGIGVDSFLMVFPSEARPAPRRDFAGTVLPRALAPERVVFDLPRGPFEQALDALLRTSLTDDLHRLRQISSALAASEREFSNEIIPGVVVPHAQVHGLPEPMLFLGISPDGIEFPNATRPARIVFILLSPPDEPEQHLRDLAEVVRLVGNHARVRALLASSTADDLVQAFRTDGGKGAIKAEE